MATKYITFFLPQFHSIPENDEWWEKDFTEWTNVRRAKPVFENQIQPKVPLNGNYYNLLEKSTVEWQTELMHKYGVYGFCYFHYWFKGYKLLNKPAENLLEWKDINQKFCFAWANCTWARTWSAVRGTSWAPNDKNDGKEILMEQTYGEKADWIEHYNYLKDFFKDERYIKQDGKPVFLIYKLNDIECNEDMFTVWNECAVKDGFPGIHLVSMNQAPNSKLVEAVAKYGNYSSYATSFLKKVINKLFKAKTVPSYVYEYENVWKGLVKEKYARKYVTYPGAVVTYDETPRRGANSTYLKNASPRLFEKYLRLQTQKRNAEFLFIDAWNEWGEGNYLEPDEENGYAYLEALSKVSKEL